jgi:hypothetical protein
MVIVFAIFGAFLAICAIGLSGLGIGMLIDGNSAGVVGALCGLPVGYGGYLFWRAAVRVRRDLRDQPPNPEERRSHQATVRFLLGYAASLIIGAFVVPVPGVLRVVMIFAALCVLPLILARKFEPTQKRKAPGR